jgi:hypothetical protein
MAKFLLSELLTHSTQQLSSKHETCFFDSSICVSVSIKAHLLAKLLERETLNIM